MEVRVREMQEKDLELILKWRTDPKISKYMKTDPQLTMDMQRKWFEDIKKNTTVKYWLVEVKGNPAGLMYLTDINCNLKKCEWGYYIGETKYRSFAAAIALECSLYDYVFDKLRLEKICCECLGINTGVIKLHEYTGNHIDEIQKNSVLKNGVYYDLVFMSMTSEEWSKKRKEFTYERITF